MACNYTRTDISRLVLEVIRAIQRDPTITEESEFSPQDINNDPTFRAGYFDPIRMRVVTADCVLNKFSVADCKNARTVGDIVDAVWNDFKPA